MQSRHQSLFFGWLQKKKRNIFFEIKGGVRRILPLSYQGSTRREQGFSKRSTHSAADQFLTGGCEPSFFAFKLTSGLFPSFSPV
jgi:hypothetical protein